MADSLERKSAVTLPYMASSSDSYDQPPIHQRPEAAWIEAAGAVLRKSGRLTDQAPDSEAWGRLATRTVEGIVIPPLGAESDLAALPTIGALTADPGQAPFLRGSRAATGWDVRVAIADPATARATALQELAGGATSLWVLVGAGGLASADLPAALDGVDLAIAPIVLDTRPTADGPGYDVTSAAASALRDIAAERGTPLHPDSSLGADPIREATAAALATADTAPGAAATSGNTVAPVGAAAEPADNTASEPRADSALAEPRPDEAQLGAAVVAAARLAADLGIGAIVVDGTAAHDAGAGDALEIAYTLAAGAAYLRLLTAAGIAIDDACRLISFRYAVTDRQFEQIAKLRAARLAWYRVCELSGAAPASCAQRQHAVTSTAMMTRYDAHTNMLRGTIAAFAAAVGGAEAITVTPFDAADHAPSDFGRRMARNISALLAGESHIDAVADPAAGAYAVEMLTASLAESAWAEFGRIEEAGGLVAALSEGSFVARVTEVRAERDRRIATRRQPITGISEFPNAAESPMGRSAPPATSHRWAQPFERLRDTPPAGEVLLVRIGSEAAASPRITFTENLLAAGGIAIQRTDSDEFAAAPTPERTVIFAGADADYAAHLAGALAAARAADARAVFLAGRPKGVDLTALDGTVAVGDDVLAFLTAVRHTLGGTP